jgi:hypothetical protein
MSASKEEKSAPSPSGPDPVSTPKKAWHKPTYRFEQVFETRALMCGKTGTQSQCQHNRKS